MGGNSTTFVGIGLFLLFLLSFGCCLCAVSRQGGRVGGHGVPAKGLHTHTHTKRVQCAALMSYAQRYARTKLVLYILCAVKRLLSAICGAGVEMGGHRNVHGIFTCFLPAESEESHGTWLTLYLCLIGARRSCLNLWKFSSGMRTSELRVVAAIHSLCLQTSLAVQLYIL